MEKSLLLLALLCASSNSLSQDGNETDRWIRLFNGNDLSNWVAKFTGHPLGENYLDTFRAEGHPTEFRRIEILPLGQEVLNIGTLNEPPAMAIAPSR